MRIRGEYWAIAAGLSFVGLELSVKTAAPYAPPMLGSFVRILPIFVAAWLATLVRAEDRQGLSFLFSRERLLLLGALVVDGFLNMYLANSLKLYALQKGGIVLTLTAVEVGQLLGAAVLVRWWLRGRISAPVWVGMLVIITGTAIASWSQVFIPDWGGVLGISLIAGLCFAVSVACVGYVLRHGVGLWPSLAVSTTVGLIVTTAVGSAAGEAPTPVAIGHIGSTGILFLLLSGLAYASALFFLTGALQRISIVRANAISGANGPVAALAGALIFGPSAAPALLVGVVLVAIGAVMVRTRSAMDAIEDAPEGAQMAH